MTFHYLTMIAAIFLVANSLFSGLASASCNGDNCLNAFVNHISSASAFCNTFLPQPVPSPNIPAFASPCLASTSRLSSACSCIATTIPTTPPSTSCPTVTISLSPTSCPPTSTTSPTTCPSVTPPSTITVTSVTTTTVSTCSSASTAPPCSCTSLIPNPSFESPTASPWEIINNDPNAHWSLAPSADMPIPALDGQWALQFSWPANTVPTQEVGIYQSVPIPSCCIGPVLTLNFAFLTVANTCGVSLYWNVITPAQPSGQIGSFPEESFTIQPAPNWQTNSNSWEFQAQQGFQVEILLSCENSAPVWIDMVSLGT